MRPTTSSSKNGQMGGVAGLGKFHAGRPWPVDHDEKKWGQARRQGAAVLAKIIFPRDQLAYE